MRWSKRKLKWNESLSSGKGVATFFTTSHVQKENQYFSAPRAGIKHALIVLMSAAGWNFFKGPTFIAENSKMVTPVQRSSTMEEEKHALSSLSFQKTISCERSLPNSFPQTEIYTTEKFWRYTTCHEDIWPNW